MSFPDPRPQAEIRTTSGPNSVEPRSPYVDQSRTRRNITGTAPAPNPTTFSVDNTGFIRYLYANDKSKIIQIDLSSQASIPPLPPSQPLAIVRINGIPRERNYYANKGMHGQPFFNNVGG